MLCNQEAPPSSERDTHMYQRTVARQLEDAGAWADGGNDTKAQGEGTHH